MICHATSDYAIISRFYCKQLREKSKTIVCFWEPHSEHVLLLSIYDSHGRIRKLLNVTGVLEVIEAQDMDFGETYIMSLCGMQTMKTLLRMSYRVKIQIL